MRAAAGRSFAQAQPVAGGEEGQVFDFERVEHVAQRPDQATEADQRAAQMRQLVARLGVVLDDQGFLDVIEAVAEHFHQRLQPVGGAQAETRDQIGGGNRRVMGLLPIWRCRGNREY